MKRMREWREGIEAVHTDKGSCMKSVIAGVLLVLMASIAVGEEYREFTDTQGRSIRARIIEFDSGKGKLLIEREGGKQVWVAPTAFSEVDRDYIQEWIRASEALSKASLEFSFELMK